MNILSFDVGIKNLAYCLVNVTDAAAKKFDILDWGVINLMVTDKTADASHKCMTCSKKATLQTMSGDRYYCAIHAKKDAHFKPIDNKFKEFAVVHSLDKIPMKRLNEFVAHHSIIITGKKKPLKAELTAIVKKFISDWCFVKCGSEEKKKKANDFDLVSLGVALRDKFDVTFADLTTVGKIVIENQIGPLAIRMKSLQGMITQYFIMKGLEDISYISASNKLKMFEGTELMYEVDSDQEDEVEKNDKDKYTERKDKSVEIVAKLVDGMPIWEKVFKTHAKKDDLADSLLQALWYASSK